MLPVTYRKSMLPLVVGVEPLSMMSDDKLFFYLRDFFRNNFKHSFRALLLSFTSETATQRKCLTSSLNLKLSINTIILPQKVMGSLISYPEMCLCVCVSVHVCLSVCVSGV